MNRYNIAVCDDDIGEQSHVCHQIDQILKEHDASYSIRRFASGESIIDAIIRQREKFDILFLDILMDEVNGVKAARKIREEDADVSIVFITSSPHYVFQGYDVQALHYMIKPVDTKKLAPILLHDFSKRNEKKHIYVKSKYAVNRILHDDIIYMESKGRKVFITTKKGEYETYGLLSEFYDKLPSNYFVSCHKSFVVNLEYISQIKRTSFTTAYGQIIPISRACYSDAKKAFINFIGKGI